MTWISFENVHVRKLMIKIHVLVFTISLFTEAVTAAEFETFTVGYGLQNL